MNQFLLLVPGLAFGLAVAFVAAAMLPAQPSLDDAIANLTGARRPDTEDRELTRRERIGVWVRNRTQWAPRSLMLSERDREVIGITTAELHFRKGLGAVIGALAPIAVGLLQQLTGTGTLLLPAIFSVLGAVIGWVLPDRLLRSRAERARNEYERIAAVYLELVGTSIHRGLPAATALNEAASIANTPTLRRIRRTLNQAALNHDKPWDAIADLAVALDVPAMGEVARIVSLSGDRGGTVYAALTGRGKSLRTEMLARVRDRENKRNENLTFPVVLTGGFTLAILVAPMLMNVADLSSLSVSP